MAKARILIIDDDEELLEELKESLSLAGYDVNVHSDASGATGLIEKAEPDLVLLDIRLKGQSGFQIARELRQGPRTAQIPIIAMTGFYSREGHGRIMDDCGFKNCLLKPFSIPDLIAAIEAVVHV